MGRGRVIVVGASNTDLVVHCPKLPRAGESVMGGDLLTFAGGKGANQAVAAARAGARAVFIGAFGDDAFGQARRADLEREGVDCSGCVVKKKVPSGVALIGIGDCGGGKAENLIVVAPGANLRLTAEDVTAGMPQDLNSSDVVLCSLEVPMPAVMEAFRCALDAESRATTILNPAPFPKSGVPDKLILDAAVVTPNETEFKALVKARVGGDMARKRLISLMAQENFDVRISQQCVVTCGAKGALWYAISDADGAALSSPSREFKRGLRRYAISDVLIPAPRVPPVDTVGAGDCFNGCLAAHLTFEPSDFRKAIHFGVAAAAIKVTRHGAQAGMPYRREILRMLQKN
ncbi:MAG TPA: ribokinase [Planctomycetota bacterium]|jgi:ribokinase